MVVVSSAGYRCVLAVLVVMLTVLGGSPAVRGQGRAQPTPHDEVAVAIPGVIAGGEKVEMLSANIVRGDGVIGLFDGSAAIIEQGDRSRAAHLAR